MKKVLICPDKFKGSLSAHEAAEAIAKGIKAFDKNIETVICPLADGGEGSIDIVSNLINANKILKTVTDPLGREIETYYYGKGNSAYIEMSKASGLATLSPDEYNPSKTSTYGTGQLINHALNRGYDNIYLFIGGSATPETFWLLSQSGPHIT